MVSAVLSKQRSHILTHDDSTTFIGDIYPQVNSINSTSGIWGFLDLLLIDHFHNVGFCEFYIVKAR